MLRLFWHVLNNFQFGLASILLAGCEVLFVPDGNWKLKYAHCMWYVPVTVEGLAKAVNYPSICPLSPERGNAFCKKHCADACNKNIPTGLHEFLQHCGVKGKGTRTGSKQFSFGNTKSEH